MGPDTRRLLPRRAGSFFETEALKANEAAGGGLRGAGAGLRVAVDKIKRLAENYEDPAIRAGQEMRAGFTGEPAPASTLTNDTMLPSPAEEAARRQGISVPARSTILARPEGTASIQPRTGAVATAPLTEKERIAGIAGRISPENPYGANMVGGNMRTGQIWAGARTDAEAARNLQDRAAQDEAAKNAAASFDRQTQALKSLREARSPGFSFGVDSIGGGPDVLDVASGRVINRDTPANVVADRMRNAVQTARNFGAGGKAGRIAAEQIGKAYIADKELQGLEAQLAAKQETGINPVDMGRFLLDQQKFAQQQGLDRARLNIDEATLRDKMAGTAQKAREYNDAQRKSFMDNFTAPEGAPRDEIASGILAMSRATGGEVYPDELAPYVWKAAEMNKVDWKNGPPTGAGLSTLLQQALALRAAEKG